MLDPAVPKPILLLSARATLWLWTVLLAWLVSPPCLAGSLEQVRVFAGQDHARILLVTDGPVTEMRSRATPPRGALPARGIVILDKTKPGEKCPNLIPINDRGVKQVRIDRVGDGVQVTIEVDEARELHATALGKTAVLIDLMVEGRGEDGQLPTRAQLQDWLAGVSLLRAAGGPPKTRHLIVLDAGHGGFDHGAVGVTGTREADIALQLSLRTAALLRQQPGLEVLLTRETDEFIPLGERAAIANRNDADLFLSIHANASPLSWGWGIETYSLDTASDAGAARVASRENVLLREQAEEGNTDPLLASLTEAGTNRLSKDLAATIQNTTIQHLTQLYGSDQVKDLSSKTALFTVLSRSRMPAILYEAGFLANVEDERRLRTPQFQQATAEALAAAVESWLERQE